MKKLILFLITLTMLVSTIPAAAAFGYSVELDGKEVDVNALFQNGTIYLKLEDISDILMKNYDTDKKLDCAFVGGIYLLAEKASSTSIYIDGKRFTPTDDAGKEISPLICFDEVYLPVHSVCEAFNLIPSWDNQKHILSLLSNVGQTADFLPDESKTYVIINKETGNAITASDSVMDLTLTPFTKSPSQQFTFVKTEFDGFYHIKSTLTGKNLDVLSHGTTPGVAIITWEQGAGDNQKFAIENVPGGTLIYARSCSLPLEDSNGGVIQNSRSETSSQKWIISEASTYKPVSALKVNELSVSYTPPVPTEEELLEKAPYKTFTIGELSLSSQASLSVAQKENLLSQKWALESVGESTYIITNAETNKAIDVSGLSLKAGDSVITYNTNRDLNQQWVLEKNADGTYLIKSAHSNLYLTATDDGKMVQEVKNPSLKQNWTMTPTY